VADPGSARSHGGDKRQAGPKEVRFRALGARGVENEVIEVGHRFYYAVEIFGLVLQESIST